MENEIFKQNKERLELDSNNRLKAVEVKNLIQENMDLEYYILSSAKTQEIVDQNFDISQQNVEKVTKDKVAEYDQINQRIVNTIYKHNLFYFKY